LKWLEKKVLVWSIPLFGFMPIFELTDDLAASG